MSNIIEYFVNNTSVMVAVVSATVSICVAIVTVVANPISQRFVERAKTELQKELEEHKKQITKEVFESNARMAYEFEARKRLYAQVEPLLFQIFEASEQCYYRVASLVRTHRAGCLDGKSGWLAQEGYYMHSSIYWLFLPLALFRNLQRNATFFDLRLDENIRIRYFLLKWSYLCFTDDFTFANRDPKIPYQPNIGNWREGRDKDPARLWRQALVLGHLDRLTDAMVIADGNTRRAMTFGEFERQSREDEEFRALIMPAIDTFQQFGFESRPVLARILLTQAVIHRLILFTYTCNADIVSLNSALRVFVRSKEFSDDLAWWSGGGEAILGIVIEYVEERLNWISPDDYAIRNSEVE